MELATKMDYARAMASSNLLPKQYQNNPANLLFALEYADALGVSPINAITSIHVIEGKPSASADLIAAMIRRAGHKLRVTGDDTRATAVLIRADDPEFEYEATWTIDKARAASLTGKSVWKNYPGAMLRSRAITEVARMGASDALFGVVYTPEELGAEVTGDGAPLHPSPPIRTGAERLRAAVAGADPPPVPTDHSDTGPVQASAERADDGITPAQLRKLHAALNEAGLGDRGAGLAYLTDLLGREITTSKELSKDDASRAIDDLERGDAHVAAAEPTLDWPEVTEPKQ
jgi:hypothetical protein